MPSLSEFMQVKAEENKLQSYVPTLFIGIGGTGRDVLMRLRKRLYDDGASSRPYLRYLMIDTEMEKWWPSGASQEEYEPVRPAPGETVSCQISETDFLGVFKQLEQMEDPRYVDWLKPELRNLGYAAVIHGAGTWRPFGRVAFMLNCEQTTRGDGIRQGIHTRLTDMLEQVAHSQAEDLNGATVDHNALEVVIITSLAGGTGAGMFLDIAYLVKDLFQTIPIRGVNLAASWIQLKTSERGTTARAGPLAWRRYRRRWSRARTWIVLPRPMSSARIPPKPNRWR